MIGTIANIVLDPIFISGLGMGAAGAAIATTIGNVLACLYYLWYFLKKTKDLLDQSLVILPAAMVDSRQGLHHRAADSDLFRPHERVHDHPQPDSGGRTAMRRWRPSALCSKPTCLSLSCRWGWPTACSRCLDITTERKIWTAFSGGGAVHQNLLHPVVGIASVILYYVCREPIIRIFINDSDVVAYGVRDAHRLHAVRAGDRHPVYEHELHAVGGTRVPGHRAFRAAPGHPADSSFVSAGRSVWSEWRYLWTEHH